MHQNTGAPIYFHFFPVDHAVDPQGPLIVQIYCPPPPAILGHAPACTVVIHNMCAVKINPVMLRLSFSNFYHFTGSCIEWREN